MEQETLKLGIVGAGGICNGCHLPAYCKMKNVDIVAVCDIKIERAVALAKKYVDKTGKPEPAVFEKYTDLINMPGIQAVDICTPNYLHSIIAVEALNHGLHTFCEKPDAINTVEAQKMKDAAEKSGKTLMVMRNNRYMNVSRYLKNISKTVRWAKYTLPAAVGREDAVFPVWAVGLPPRLSPAAVPLLTWAYI